MVIKEHQVKCIICEKAFIAKTELLKHTVEGKTKNTTTTYSDNGVCWNNKPWFCNNCWGEVLGGTQVWNEVVEILNLKN